MENPSDCPRLIASTRRSLVRLAVERDPDQVVPIHLGEGSDRKARLVTFGRQGLGEDGRIDVDVFRQQVVLLQELPELAGRGRALRARLAHRLQVAGRLRLGFPLVILLQGTVQRGLDQLDQPEAEEQSQEEACHQARDRAEQARTEIFEVLPEGHRRLAEEILVRLEQRHERTDELQGMFRRRDFYSGIISIISSRGRNRPPPFPQTPRA